MWSNQEPDNKNLEALAQSFSLENLLTGAVLTAVPTTQMLPSGRLALVRSNNVLYLYLNDAGTLRRITFGTV